MPPQPTSKNDFLGSHFHIVQPSGNAVNSLVSLPKCLCRWLRQSEGLALTKTLA